jgi:hypothetical protein
VEDEALMSEMEDKTIGYLKKRVEDDQYCFDDDMSIDSEPSLARHKSQDYVFLEETTEEEKKLSSKMPSTNYSDIGDEHISVA